MSVTLAVYNDISTLVSLDPDTGKIEQGGKGPAQGVTYLMGDSVLALYRQDGKLWLRCGKDTYRFRKVRVTHHRKGGDNELLVSQDGERKQQYRYPAPEGTSGFTAADDPTALASDDDFDFGLYLANLNHDRDRQAHVFRNEGNDAD